MSEFNFDPAVTSYNGHNALALGRAALLAYDAPHYPQVLFLWEPGQARRSKCLISGLRQRVIAANRNFDMAGNPLIYKP